MSEQEKRVFDLHIRDSKGARVPVGSALLDDSGRLTLNLSGVLAFPIHGRLVRAPWEADIAALEKLAEVEA